MKNLIFGLVISMFLGLNACTALTGDKVAMGSLVTLEVSSYFPDGRLFETNKEKMPMTLLVGNNMIAPKFEEALVGIKKGGTKKFTLKAKDFMPNLDPKRIITLRREQVKFDEGFDAKPGAVFSSSHTDPETKKPVSQSATIVKLDDKEIVLDYNHPLAGKDVTFEVKILTIDSVEKSKKISEKDAVVKPKTKFN